MDVLEVEAHQEGNGKGRRVVDEGSKIGVGEHRVLSEEREGNEGILSSPFDAEEEDSQDCGEQQEEDTPHIRNEREPQEETGEGKGGEARTRDIESGEGT